jgi:protoporphyrinogen oxidase
MRPYNEKLWTVPIKTLTAEWAAPFIPRPSKKEILLGATASPAVRGKNFGYNASFYYPESGGIQPLIDSLALRTADLKTGTKIIRVNLKKKYAEASDGKKYHYDTLVSSAPLNELIKMTSDVPAEVAAAAKKLRWNSVHCLNIAFDNKYAGPNLAGRHWVYFPQKIFNFYRAGVYSNISPRMAPRGMSSMYIEISTPGGGSLDKKSAFAKVKRGLVSAGILAPQPKIDIAGWLDMPYAYVIYDRNRAGAVKTIQEFLLQNGVRSIGRYGAWKYSFMEESIWEGMRLAKELNDK